MRKGGWVGNREPLVEGCPCTTCQRHDRDYVSYLSRAEELTAVRLIVIHNLTYMRELTTHARAAIQGGNLRQLSLAPAQLARHPGRRCQPLVDNAPVPIRVLFA